MGFVLASLCAMCHFFDEMAVSIVCSIQVEFINLVKGWGMNMTLQLQVTFRVVVCGVSAAYAVEKRPICTSCVRNAKR